jgi:hypothetical protein
MLPLDAIGRKPGEHGLTVPHWPPALTSEAPFLLMMGSADLTGAHQ